MANMNIARMQFATKTACNLFLISYTIEIYCIDEYASTRIEAIINIIYKKER